MGAKKEGGKKAGRRAVAPPLVPTFLANTYLCRYNQDYSTDVQHSHLFSGARRVRLLAPTQKMLTLSLIKINPNLVQKCLLKCCIPTTTT